MADEASVVASMQAAFQRARETLTTTLQTAKTDVVDRPWDGRKLTSSERLDGYRMALKYPSVVTAKQSEMGRRYHLTKERPVSRRVFQWVNQAIRETQGDDR